MYCITTFDTEVATRTKDIQHAKLAKYRFKNMKTKCIKKFQLLYNSLINHP